MCSIEEDKSLSLQYLFTGNQKYTLNYVDNGWEP